MQDHLTPFKPYKFLVDIWFMIAVVIVLSTDQGSKHLVKSLLDLGESVPSDGIFRITYITNSGGIFGFFQSQTVALTFLSSIGIGVLGWLYYRYGDIGRAVRLSLGLQVGGALGNLADRLRFGSVIDFLDVGYWPVFNIADAAIVCGVLFLVVTFIFDKSSDPKTSEVKRRLDGVNESEEYSEEEPHYPV